ncbi:dihydrodipicolinate synthetase [Robbsia andropogonis]|uniref:Dihydrodipicolinate synthetase n=1 Tax=Robbsia andropogonis TaxID=28092 RepID=A0A0F5JUI1_9BURK|nr:dihydrodipicolinate synthase family protein [Robbsia andropogonis]KKB61503.1 dihydrodipicolinate synthetase [Robbsia andropogonis]MCP1120920.1 dihydrodipicolinate synthase family protein [Robbsia andropogonis]MCP1130706.1 dihydrodipicolinate synthase family protein [Robbsia andropogonis]
MSRLDERASGVFVIAVTPFTDDGSLDLTSTDSMVDFYLEKGATGLTVLGMMGEAPKLTTDESAQFVKRVMARVGPQFPVVVGVSAPGFASMKELSSRVMDLGASGVMVAPPSTLRTDDQLFHYFTGAAETLGDTPWVLQDFPLATTVQMSASAILRIVEAVPSCVMLKHEDWPGLAKIDALRAAEKKGARRISILTGNGGMFLPEEMHRGADGAMTGFAYPEMMSQIVAAHHASEFERAQDLFDAYLPLARYEQQPGLGLAVRKYTLAKRGAIATPMLRRPGPTLSAGDIADIDRLTARLARRLKELD